MGNINHFKCSVARAANRQTKLFDARGDKCRKPAVETTEKEK